MMKSFIITLFLYAFQINVIFATHKPGHSGGGGGGGKGKNNAPEIDQNSILAIILFFICLYLIYYFQTKKHDSEIDA